MMDLDEVPPLTALEPTELTEDSLLFGSYGNTLTKKSSEQPKAKRAAEKREQKARKAEISSFEGCKKNKPF